MCDFVRLLALLSKECLALMQDTHDHRCVEAGSKRS